MARLRRQTAASARTRPPTRGFASMDAWPPAIRFAAGPVKMKRVGSRRSEFRNFGSVSANEVQDPFPASIAFALQFGRAAHDHPMKLLASELVGRRFHRLRFCPGRSLG